MSAEEPQQTVIYREATEADFPAVEAMYDKLDAASAPVHLCLSGGRECRRPVAGYVPAHAGTLQRAVCREVEGEVVGFIVARLKRVPEYLGGVMVGELKDMWVEPEVRRLGIGEKLLRLAIEWCRAAECLFRAKRKSWWATSRSSSWSSTWG